MIFWRFVTKKHEYYIIFGDLDVSRCYSSITLVLFSSFFSLVFEVGSDFSSMRTTRDEHQKVISFVNPLNAEATPSTGERKRLPPHLLIVTTSTITTTNQAQKEVGVLALDHDDMSRDRRMCEFRSRQSVV